MAKAKYKTFEEAQEAQVEGKTKVRDAKQNLTSYLKDNKLKRNVDYSNDKKHSKKIEKLNNVITRASSNLEKINEAVKGLKPKKERTSKYDYPEGITADEKKKFRQKVRSEANKDSKPKKEKKAKAEKKGKTGKPKKESKKETTTKRRRKSKK